MSWYLDYLEEKAKRDAEYAKVIREEFKAPLSEEELTFVGFDLKIKVDVVDGNFRLKMKCPDLMDQYVDITDKVTTEFAERIFAQFFKLTRESA